MRLQQLQFFALWVMATTLCSMAQGPGNRLVVLPFMRLYFLLRFAVIWEDNPDSSSPQRPSSRFGHVMWTSPSGYDHFLRRSKTVCSTVFLSFIWQSFERSLHAWRNLLFQ